LGITGLFFVQMGGPPVDFDAMMLRPLPSAELQRKSNPARQASTACNRKSFLSNVDHM
jgi:hypothetical protein